MTTIRKQSIISSGVVYIGLALGAAWQYVLAKEFNPDQYGLINGMFIAIGTVLSYLASFGMPPVINKFYPYYKDHLPAKKNDLIGLALLVCLVGFFLTTILGVIFHAPISHFYAAQSPMVVRYYYWIFPFGLGMTLFTVLEVYGWQIKRSVLTSYLREILFRVVAFVLLLLYVTGVLRSFDTFVKLYAFIYLLIALLLGSLLWRSGQLHFSFGISRVTKRFSSKIRTLALMGWGGNVFLYFSFYFAQIVIAGVAAGGLTAVGVFTLAQFASSLIQAPQRAVAAASVGPLSQAWKAKDIGRVGRIYQRSAINQLIFSLGLFFLIWINYRDGILVFHLNPAYLAGQSVLLYVGLARVVDLGTGVNSQVIGTSVRWRVELLSGVILVSLTIPLSYFLARRMGIVGPAIADLTTISIYNFIRWIFLYRAYRFQPFDWRSLLTILLALSAFFVCDWLFGRSSGLVWIIVRSALFLGIYAGGVLAFRLSEDVLPVWQTIKKRLGFANGG
jgi:O-antigen/teichoic acid export membrane protein